jgi:uncharacterized protein
VSDESPLQVQLKHKNSSLSLSTIRSGLIARGLRDAESIARQASGLTDPLSETRRLAEEGDPDAQFRLGCAYSVGEGMALDDSEALIWVRKAAGAGHVLAEELLGFLYYDGRGVQQDYSEAVKWLRKCMREVDGHRPERSELGVTELILGKCYFYGLGVQQDYIEAARWLLEAFQTDAPTTKPGNPYDEIGYLLSRIYSLDEVVKRWRGPAEGEVAWQSYTEDANWHREGAEAEHTENQFCLGLAYAYGLGVPKDYAAAASWFRRAAEAGDVWAQLHLAVAYAKGRGVALDYTQAFMWFNIAATRTTSDRQKHVSDACDEVARRMTHQQITEAQRLAREWKPIDGRR